MNGIFRIPNRTKYKNLWLTLYFGVWCGFINVLVDFDHALAYLLNIEDGRFLHLPIFVLAVIVFIGTLAYYSRLYSRMVLGERNRYSLDSNRKLHIDREYR